MKRVVVAVCALALASIPATAFAGGGYRSVCPDQEKAANGTRVDMKNLCFLPGILDVQKGASVTFTNFDDLLHSVTTANAEGILDEKYDQGDYSVIRFDSAGVYKYYCVYHPAMVGTVRVGSSNAIGAASGLTRVKAGTDVSVMGREVAPSPVNLAPTTPVAKSSSKAGFGLLGIIPAAGLIWYGIRRHRHHEAA